MTAADALRARLAGTPTVGVIGLGYVGLPLAVAFAESGARVLGIDRDAHRVERVRAGQSFVEDVSAATLAPLVASGRLSAAGDVAALAGADAIVICVPTPLGKSKEPDISFIVGAADAVAAIIRPGQLVVLESTTYPGTTQEVLLPRFAARGLRAGEDFFLAFSPERIDPGNRKYTLRDIPKVVGGLTPACRDLVTMLYARVASQIVPVSGPETAEMVKLFENTFRSVNIALVNEFAIMCRRLGISVWEVIGAAATKPFGFMPFYPGPGLGGHCIPVDPFYLSWKARESGFEARFIELAGAVNTAMPHYVVSLIADALKSVRLPLNGSRVLVAGVSYKRDVDDIRESPALDLLGLLRARGAEVAYSDPHVLKLAGRHWQDGIDLEHVDLNDALPGTYDCIVIVTDHSRFDYDRLQQAAKVVVDTRNAIPDPGPNVTRIGAPRPVAAAETLSVA